MKILSNILTAVSGLQKRLVEMEEDVFASTSEVNQLKGRMDSEKGKINSQLKDMKRLWKVE